MNVKHIQQALRPFFAKNPTAVLDGELYNHGLKDDFEKIISLVKKKKPTDQDKAEAKELVQYHIYDVASMTIATYFTRLNYINSSFKWNHILRRDSGDGIPNVLSDDDTFIEEGKSQSPLRQQKIDTWIENADNLKDHMDETTYRNFQRNKKFIDLTDIPEHLQQLIINTYDEQSLAPKMKVLNYLIKKRCNQLIEVVEEFYNV